MMFHCKCLILNITLILCKYSCQMHALLPTATNWLFSGQLAKYKCWWYSCTYVPRCLGSEKIPKNIILINDTMDNYLQYVIVNVYHWYYQTEPWVSFCIDGTKPVYMLIWIPDLDPHLADWNFVPWLGSISTWWVLMQICCPCAKSCI